MCDTIKKALEKGYVVTTTVSEGEQALTLLHALHEAQCSFSVEYDSVQGRCRFSAYFLSVSDSSVLNYIGNNWEFQDTKIYSW